MSSSCSTSGTRCVNIIRKPVINLAYYLHLISFIKHMCNPDLICPNIILKVSNMLSKHVHIFYMTILIIIFALRYSQFYGNANWNEHYICMFSDRTVFVRRDHYLYVLRGHDCCPVVVSLNGQYIFMFSANLLFSSVFFFHVNVT